MKDSVVIKSNQNGLFIYLDDSLTYPELLKAVQKKFQENAKFFEGSQVAVSFEGRHLTKEEEWEIMNLISQTAHIHIVCLLDHHSLEAYLCKEIVEERIQELSIKDGLFYKGTIQKKQVLESERNITILGDVEAGATVVSKGNIIVLGRACGKLHAGATGNQDAIIVALSLQSQSVKIADIKSERLFYRPKDTGLFQNPEIVLLKNKQLYITPLSLENK